MLEVPIHQSSSTSSRLLSAGSRLSGDGYNLRPFVSLILPATRSCLWRHRLISSTSLSPISPQSTPANLVGVVAGPPPNRLQFHLASPFVKVAIGNQKLGPSKGVNLGSISLAVSLSLGLMLLHYMSYATVAAILLIWCDLCLGFCYQVLKRIDVGQDQIMVLMHRLLFQQRRIEIEVQQKDFEV